MRKERRPRHAGEGVGCACARSSRAGCVPNGSRRRRAALIIDPSRRDDVPLRLLLGRCGSGDQMP
jgi:hypothetical protein